TARRRTNASRRCVWPPSARVSSSTPSTPARRWWGSSPPFATGGWRATRRRCSSTPGGCRRCSPPRTRRGSYAEQRMPFPHKLLNEGEDIVLDLRPHWMYFSGPTLAVLLTATLSTVVEVHFRHGWDWLK